jgi:hypothetical protein
MDAPHEDAPMPSPEWGPRAHARVSPLQSLRFANENQLVTANIRTALQPRGFVQIVNFPSEKSYFGFAAGFASGFAAGTPRGSSAGFT